jgi:C-terminal processing protease CtpA/Prc
MKRLLFGLLYLLTISPSFGQTAKKDLKYSKEQLKEDLTFLKQQVFNVHVYPYTELSRKQYEKFFDDIGFRLKDSLTATDFLKLVKPVIAHLSDEHSNISLKEPLLSQTYLHACIFIPFSLVKTKHGYAVDLLFDKSGAINTGDEITAINNVSVETWVNNCALYCTGFPDQRVATALKQFGFLSAWANPDQSATFEVKTGGGKTHSLKGTSFAIWDNYIYDHAAATGCTDRISYQRYGDVGYINACSFDVKSKGPFALDSVKSKVTAAFKQAQTDGVKTLVIDVSKNGGGNSKIGNYILDCFYDKPYLTYQSNWKKSEEYLKLLTSWGFSDEYYSKAKVGEVLHFDPQTVTPSDIPFRFKGKVVIVVGKATFSSAMLFATEIKDNHITKIIGQVPENGHPNGFGELYNTTLPNTKIDLRFGVKEWIRPAGKTGDNVLHPDVELSDEQMASVAGLIKAAN